MGVFGCGDSGTTPDPNPNPDPDPDPIPGGSLALELVASGLSDPILVTAPTGDLARLFVVERPGRIRIVENGVLLPNPFLDIRSLTSTSSERGFLSMAFHPQFTQNGEFFVSYTDVTTGGNRIARYTVSGNPNIADGGSGMILLSVAQPFENHNGGHIAFGPDGMLYIAIGDGGGGGDPLGSGQNRLTLLGAMLRIDVDGGTPFAIPPDNPFVGDPTGADEIWASGLRNPWRYSFDRLTGDLYIADVGQNQIEEVDVQLATSLGGENYGWNTMEGSTCFQSGACDMTGLTLPVLEYDHGQGCSITGGYVYRGTSIPSLSGRYLYADFCSGFVRSFELQGGAATSFADHSDFLSPNGSIASFGEDAAGELYILTIEGSVFRIIETEG